MSTTPNEAPVPEATQEYQSPYQSASTKQEVPPVPPAPYPAQPVNYGQPEHPTEGYGQHQQPAAPNYSASPAPQPVYYPEAPYQGAQPQYGYQQPVPGHNGYPGYGLVPPTTPGQQAASSSMTMGIIATVITFTIGWIPFIGLLGVAGGIGLGIAALLGAKKAEEQRVDATAGKTLGWIAIGFSVFWVLIYLFLMAVGAAVDPGTSV